MAARGRGQAPSDEAVREATGRDRGGWLAVLDAAGARDLDHRGIVAHLEREHPEVSGWWRQSISVADERARGMRAVGEAAGGFQVGVQRTVAAGPDRLWELIAARPDLWLGEGASIELAEGRRFEAPADGGAAPAGGEVRVVRPGERLRMTWRQEGWDAPATLQLMLTPRRSRSRSGGTTVGAYLERLPDAAAREAMRARLREALERLAAALGDPAGPPGGDPR